MSLTWNASTIAPILPHSIGRRSSEAKKKTNPIPLLVFFLSYNSRITYPTASIVLPQLTVYRAPLQPTDPLPQIDTTTPTYQNNSESVIDNGLSVFSSYMLRFSYRRSTSPASGAGGAFDGIRRTALNCGGYAAPSSLDRILPLDSEPLAPVGFDAAPFVVASSYVFGGGGSRR